MFHWFSACAKAGAIFSIATLTACADEDWPDRGRADIERMIQFENFAFDCYQSDWSKNEGMIHKELSNLRNLGPDAKCVLGSDQPIWQSTEDVVNATFRCQKDDIIGEYSVTVFRDDSTPYGDYFCNSAHFPVSTDYQDGSVTDRLSSPY